MFQSSRIASGSRSRQTLSACSPSSASRISNSRPSRMRRATLRMTLESSTMRQVFIVSSPCPNFSGGLCRRADVQYALDVDHHQQTTVESVNSARNSREPGIEIDRVGLAIRFREAQHLADVVDHQAV